MRGTRKAVALSLERGQGWPGKALRPFIGPERQAPHSKGLLGSSELPFYPRILGVLPKS